MNRRGVFTLAVLIAAIAAVLVLVGATHPFGVYLFGAPGRSYVHDRQPRGDRGWRVAAWSLGNRTSLDDATAVGAVDEIDVDWYRSQADGGVLGRHENDGLVSAAHDRGVNVFATVTNVAGGGFSGKLAAAILASPDIGRRHIDALVTLCRRKRYDGIDLDWEMLRGADRVAYARFVEALAAALHAAGKRLAVVVFPKTSEPGLWGAQISEDYPRLGAAADELKIMTYDQHGPWSAPGPIAAVRWMSSVVRFAERRVAPRKIFMGLPLYGYEWYGKAARAIDARAAQTAARRFKGTVVHDPSSREAVLRYSDTAGVWHIAWFQDLAAIKAKLDVLTVEHPRIGGIAIWVMGDDDPGCWKLIEDTLKKST